MDPRDLIQGIQLALLQIMVWLMLLAIIITVVVVTLRSFGVDV